MKNLGKMMKQAQELQGKMASMKEKLAAMEVSGASGGGKVQLTLNGNGEARKLNIPVVAIIDSNSDPDLVDYPIPGNDDAIRAISLYCQLMRDAVLDGIQQELEGSGGDIGEADAAPVEALPEVEAQSEIKAQPEAEAKPETEVEPEKEAAPETPAEPKAEAVDESDAKQADAPAEEASKADEKPAEEDAPAEDVSKDDEKPAKASTPTD